jgi:MerR family transcriptional regulator/heat shock protein HspR
MPRESQHSSNSLEWEEVLKLLLETKEESVQRDVQRPVYYISVVAEMVEIHPQTLRMYERMGLVTPRRTRNNIRLYSDADVQRVRRIQHLTQGLGVNLAGVELIFSLLGEMERMHEELHQNLPGKNNR